MRNFYHFNASTVEEAVSLLKKYPGKAKVIAGGTDLLTELKEYVQPTQPEALINIKTIPGLDYIKEDAEGLKIGALATITAIQKDNTVKSKYSLLTQAVASMATRQLRNTGTVGGNLCQEVRCWYYRLYRNAFPCLRKGGVVCFAIAGDNRFASIFGGPKGCYAVHPSDTAPALIALGAKVKTSKRTIPLEEFFSDLAPGHVLDKDEILLEVAVPKPPESKQTFRRMTIRKAINFAIANAAVLIAPPAGTITDARVVMSGVAPKPIRSKEAEDALKGKTISEATAEAAATAAVAKAVALTMNKWKIQVAKALVKKAILE